MSLDDWHEMFAVLSRNKLRTALTALSVAWGIFMLVILLAAGQGLERGAQRDFRDEATNMLWLRGAKTSLPYKGQAPGRFVVFTNEDLDALVREIPEIDHISGRFYLWGEFFVSRGTKRASFEIRGCNPGHAYLEKTVLQRGRFINDTDIDQHRKVAIIGPEVASALFEEDEDPLGKYISIRGVQYLVVGVYTDDGGQNELKKIYIPITTAQLLYNEPGRVHRLMFSIGSVGEEQSVMIAEKARLLMARRHHFDPQDRRAVVVQNNLSNLKKITDIFAWIRRFVWVVGLGTLLAGVVGVSNIMLVSVKERTLEIGIRKAVGATPVSVVRMIVMEALTITAVAGYAGLVVGTMLVETLHRFLPENDYFRDPEVDFQAVLVATLVLVIVGALAGLVPAMRAAQVKPVVAMREA